MKKNKIIGMVLLILILSSHIHAIEAYDNINFRNLTIEDGLSQSTVETMYQDSKGYIWIGTNDGLDRYNGYEMKTYKKNKGHENSLVGNYIIDIKEDTEGNLWVGTTSGVSKINYKDDKIINYTSNPSKGNLSNNNVCEILITKDGNILVATDDGLNLYDKEKDSFSRILYKDDILTSQSIYSVSEDEYGNLWIGTDDGLNKVEVKSKTVTKIYKSEEKNSISNNFIYKVYCDKNGYVWLGTYQGGLNRINLKNNEITVYQNKEDDDKSLAGDFVRNILRSSTGQVWVCTNNGLSKYNQEDDNFINYINVSYDRYSILDNNVFSIIEDNNGLIFVGTYKGISIFDPNNKIEHYKNDPFNTNSISDNAVHGIYEDEKGLVWVGTNSKGLNIIDRESENVNHITKEDGLSSDTINAVIGDKGTVWVGTDNGLNKIDTKNKTITDFNEDLNLKSSKIKSLHLSSKNQLWIGTSDGLYILDPETLEITNVTEILEKNNISDTYIETIYEDSEGNYWIGTFVEGYLIKLDKNIEIKYKNKIGNNGIRSIVEGVQDTLWIGTSEGLIKMNKKTEKFISYTEHDGLTNNNVYGILIDSHGNPWMSTNNGISKLDISKNKFISYYLEDGLQSNEFNGNASYKNSKGEFLFGGINGLNVFNPKDLSQNSNISNVVFDEFNIKGKAYKDINNIELNHENNSVCIKFFLPNYKNNSSIQYQYKIEGKDSKWNYTNNNEVIYNDLSPGKYEFKVKARNSSGLVTEENSVVFEVKPHILLSKKAFIIYFILIIYIIYLDRSKMKRLDKLVRNRTKELNEEMEKNKKLFRKVIKLEKNKNSYFINLSHELRTPLNVISSTAQLLTALNKKDEGVSKDKLNYHLSIMDKNTKRLLNLINDIIDANKVEYGNYTLDIKTHDIVYVVEEVALSMKDYIEEKGIELIIDPEVEEKFIECDKYEIERCVINLISNSRKFTPPGGTIEVGIKDLGDKVEIIVKDSGIGIDKEHHSYIFDRFNQVVDENSEIKGGSGLGLTITKHIVNLHGGEIYLESELNKGSTFRIILNKTYIKNKL